MFSVLAQGFKLIQTDRPHLSQLGAHCSLLAVGLALIFPNWGVRE